MISQHRGYTDGRNWTHDIWSLVKFSKHQTLDPIGLQDLFLYRYPAFGRTLLEGVRLDPCVRASQISDLLAKIAAGQVVGTDFTLVDGLIRAQLKTLSRNDVTIFISGGPDSTYLYALCHELGLSVTPMTITAPGVDDTERAAAVAEYFGDTLQVQELTVESILHDLPEIVYRLGTPYDRGSVLMTFMMLQCGGDEIVVGDSGDLLFAPSFKSHYDAIEHENYNMCRLSDYAHMVLFSGTKAYTKNEAYGGRRTRFPFVGNLHGAMLFDALSEVPYYYAHKFAALRLSTRGGVRGTRQYAEPKRVLAPFMHQQLFELALEQNDLHDKLTYKGPLQKMISRYVPESAGIVRQDKAAFKLNPPREVFDTYFDGELLISYGVLNPEFDVSLLNQCIEAEWVKYQLALTSIWFNEYDEALEFRKR